MGRIKKDTIKIQLNLSNDIVQLVDNYAIENGITRTSAISILLSQQLKSLKALSDMSTLAQTLQELNFKNELM